MRKKLCFVLIFLLSCFACFFAYKEFTNKTKCYGLDSIITDFKANALIVTAGKEAECEILRDSQKTSIKIIKQKNLDGFTLTWDENGKQKVSFNGLEHQFSGKFLSENSPWDIIVSVLNVSGDISKIKNIENKTDELKFEGTTEPEAGNVQFELTTDENGLIKEINIPAKNIKVLMQSTLNLNT